MFNLFNIDKDFEIIEDLNKRSKEIENSLAYTIVDIFNLKSNSKHNRNLLGYDDLHSESGYDDVDIKKGFS